MPSKSTIVSFLLYFMGALGGLAMDWVTWAAIYYFFEAPITGQAIGKASGALFAFVIYRNTAFRDSKTDSQKEQAKRFVLAATFGWGAGVALISMFLIFLPPIAAKFASDGLTFVMNWFIMRFWVFRVSRP